MTEQVLDILKLVLLALLYLFFGRVLWAVWSEVRASGTTRNAGVSHGPVVDPSSPTVAAERPAARQRREVRPPRGRAGRVARLVVLEPKAARGQAYKLDREITIGRDTKCTITIPDDTFVSSLHAADLRPRRTTDAGGSGVDERLVPQRQQGGRRPSCSIPAIACRSATPSWRRNESRAE